jgi:hypothetical protein
MLTRPIEQRMRVVMALLAALAAAHTGAVGTESAGAGAAGCGSQTYSYAGLQSAHRGHGVRATLTALAAPRVQRGHVAAWVGVAGPKQWIQVGLSGFEGSASSSLYYEIARPGRAPEYFEVEANIAPAERRRVAVLEMRGRRGWWRVWVSGRAVSAPVRLAATGRWRGIATAESWNAGTRACNGFRYAFDGLAISGAPGGSWQRFRADHRFESPGYVVAARRPTGFIAGTR